MIAAFNRALAAQQKDGTLDAIIKKWDERYGGVK
jgi:ABC-type amino acid transport substrate-binding protein